MLGPLRRNGYRAFSVVRNHFDLFVSFYHNIHPGGGPAFNWWLPIWLARDSWIKRGDQYRAFWKYYDHSDVILRYESLAGGFRDLTGHELPIIGASRRKPHRAYYENATIDLVSRLFRDELHALGYEY